MGKAYLFASYTDFKNGKLTGAHRRFLELIKSIAATDQVIFVGKETPQLAGIANIIHYEISAKERTRMPKHLAGVLDVYRKLSEMKISISYDYAVSFHPAISICYWMAGVRNIVSLFREDMIGYLQSLQSSKAKTAYYAIQELLAVKVSSLLIIQCENDRKNLIARTKWACKNVSDKVIIQINNANASWMNTGVSRSKETNNFPRGMFIGNFSDSRKGHALLLPAVMRLLDDAYDLELFVAGDGKELEYWQEKCAQYPKIHFLGHVRDLGQYLCASDFVVVPSLIDSCPNTVLEGLNAGLAVYGTNAGGIPDLLGDPRYLFEPEEESIYCFLKNVLDTKQYLEDAHNQVARKTALTFDWGSRIKNRIELFMDRKGD